MLQLVQACSQRVPLSFYVALISLSIAAPTYESFDPLLTDSLCPGNSNDFSSSMPSSSDAPAPETAGGHSGGYYVKDTQNAKYKLDVLSLLWCYNLCSKIGLRIKSFSRIQLFCHLFKLRFFLLLFVQSLVIV